MPRPILIRTDQWAYHLTARANNKEWFYIPIDQCWRIFAESLYRASDKYESRIHTFVLMSNHFHLIASTPKRNLDDFMRYFLSIATLKIQYRAERINHIFGGRYKWSVLDSATALAYAYKYVYRNPVRAGLASTVESYPFSTLKAPHSLPIVEGFDAYWRQIPKSPEIRLKWLNKGTKPEQEILIRQGLRRDVFAFTTSSNHQKQLRSLRASYGIEAEAS